MTCDECDRDVDNQLHESKCPVCYERELNQANAGDVAYDEWNEQQLVDNPELTK